MEAALGRLDGRSWPRSAATWRIAPTACSCEAFLSRKASMNEAVRQFGEAGEVGERLRWTHGRATWGEALLAALPHLLFALATELY